MVFSFILSIAFILAGIFCFYIALSENDCGSCIAGTLALIFGVIWLSGSCIIISEQNELINMPAQVEQIKQDIKTQEEKDMINEDIKQYNAQIKKYHKDLLKETNRSKREEKLFNLQPIEEIK